MPCTTDSPCGGILIDDRALTAVERDELDRLNLHFQKCLNGHRFPAREIVKPLLVEVRQERCPQHGLIRPCQGCREAMREKRLKIAPDVALCACGCEVAVPPGRRRFATDECSRIRAARAPARGKVMTRAEVLKQRELIRVGLYR